jgi:hypothetical protein
MPSNPNQLTRLDLQEMSPAEINKARADGRLDEILAGKAEGTGDYATRNGKSRVSEPINNRDYVPPKRDASK